MRLGLKQQISSQHFRAVSLLEHGAVVCRGTGIKERNHSVLALEKMDDWKRMGG